MISIIRRKINAKTLMGQSSALKSNTEFLKKNVGNLAKVLREKNKIRPSSLMGVEEKSVVEQKRIGPGEYDKKEGLKFPGLPPILPLAGLGALAGLAALDPKMLLKRLLRTLLKNTFGKLLKKLGKVFKGLFETIGKVFRKIFNAIVDNVKKLKNFINDKFLRPLREAFESAINSKWFNRLRTFFDDIGTSIKNFIKNSADRFRTFADDIFSRVKTFANDVIDRGVRAFRSVLDNISEKILKPLKESILEFVQRVNRFVKNLGGNIVGEIGEKVIKPISENVLEPVLKKSVDTLDSVIPPIKNVPVVGPIVAEPLEGLKALFKDPLATFRNIRDSGIEKLKSLQKFGDDVGKKFKESLLTPLLQGAQKFGQSAADIGKGFVDKVGQAYDFTKSLKIPNLAEELPKKTAELVQKISTPIKNAVVQPLLSAFNIGKGGIGAVGNALGAIGSGIKPAIDLFKNIKGGMKNFLRFIGKIPVLNQAVDGFKKATTRFDKLFALGEAAVSYGLQVKAKNDGKPVDAGFLGQLEGQEIGNAILTAAGGFFGSAVGSSIGAGLGAGVLSGPLGFIGTVLGGIIGEDFGKLAANQVGEILKANNIPNRDPILSDATKEYPIFGKETAGDLSIMNFLGLGEKEEEPQGGIYASGLPPRNFALLQTEMDYNVKTEVVVMKSKEIINNSAVATAGSSGGGGGYASPMIIKTGGSALNNYKSRTLAQLS